MKGPTYSVFRAVLKEVGFVDCSVPGKYHRLNHSLPDTFVLLPPIKDEDIVPSYHIAGARTLLDYRGLMSPADFEAALRERSLAG